MFVIKKLKAHFPRHGIPEQLVSDSGPQFALRNFLKFSQEWDFEHLTSSPHHSQANGKAESSVKEAKQILKKCRKAESDTFLALLDHRNTPSMGIQISPAQYLTNCYISQDLECTFEYNNHVLNVSKTKCMLKTQRA